MARRAKTVKRTAREIAAQKWLAGAIRDRLAKHVGRTVSQELLEQIKAECLAEFDERWVRETGE